ncbi:carbohydrate ABC transporter permease [Treponema sp. C6A8]|uniref:carbohydrate ABC transporter permease n=1 Tax=Treponema sp. C6A8 TaxID=1410609 RepID=UPI00047F260A|nr:sugar ABC transporter permease [Treponema sp. C6A8]
MKNSVFKSLGEKNIRQEILMLLPACVLLIIFMVAPFFSAFGLSLSNQKLIPNPMVPAKFIGLRNYIQIFKDISFWQAFKNVILFTLMVIPLQCGFALLMANALNRVRFIKSFLRSMFFLPYITPMVIVAVIWKSIYQYPDGIANLALKVCTLGLGKPLDWLGNKNSALIAITLLSAWQAFGFQMIVYLGALQSIPSSLYEAANIDGANSRQIFFNITWPALKETNTLVLIITTIQALKLFTQVNIMTKGGPNGATNTLVHYIYQSGFTGQKIGYASAASVILFLLILVIFLVQNKLLRGKEEKSRD